MTPYGLVVRHFGRAEDLLYLGVGEAFEPPGPHQGSCSQHGISDLNLSKSINANSSLEKVSRIHLRILAEDSDDDLGGYLVPLNPNV